MSALLAVLKCSVYRTIILAFIGGKCGYIKINPNIAILRIPNEYRKAFSGLIFTELLEYSNIFYRLSTGTTADSSFSLEVKAFEYFLAISLEG